MNLLGPMFPRIVNIFIRKQKKGAEIVRVKGATLRWDRRHDNKRDWNWWIKKTGWRMKSWSENI